MARLAGVIDGPVLEQPTNMTTVLSTLRVLVVDDEPLIRWAIAETLGQEGHQVAEAGDAAGAIQALSARRAPDVVLLDFRLPDSNDLTLLATVRRLVPSAAVVMMTAVGDSEMIAAAEALGASRVVDKPIDMRDLETIVCAAAESR
jgi:DNA-binding NtrC family response regulator